MGRRLAGASLFLGLLAGLTQTGCAHKRQVYYPNPAPAQQGVRVRAPFVDVQVPGVPVGRRDRDDVDDLD